MSDPGASSRSIFGVLRERFDRLLEWSLADKCLVVAVLVFALGTSYLFWEIFILRHPGLVPYFNHPYARRSLPVHVFLYEGGWLSIIAASLWCRKHAPQSRWLVHAVCQAYCIGFAFISYELGHYTTGYLGAVLMGGAAVGFLLFEPRPVLGALASAVAVLAVTTVAEQAGLIPYGPLFTGAPFEHGRLSFWWLASIGGMNSAIVLVILALVYHIFYRWRDREAQLARAMDIIRRYVPAQLAERILAGDYASLEKRQRRRLTIFFSDIRGFTEIADRIDPEDLNRMLNEYLREMTLIAEKYGGTIDKFVGDAIVIFFGAPHATDDRDHALRALRMAMEMQRRMRELRERWTVEIRSEPFEIRIGIHTGEASVGNFGSVGRLDYTAIGTHVNLAARLQTSCEPGKILISDETFRLVERDIRAAPRGEIRVKGIAHPIRVHEVEGTGEEKLSPF